MIKIKIENPFYFERGSMSLNERQAKALKANKKLIAVNKSTGATHPVDNKIALAKLHEIRDPFSGLFMYYVTWFK